MTKLYYTPVKDTQFEEVRKAAIEIWKTYDDTYGYASGKIDRIKDIKNVKDNVMYIVSMFDMKNQFKLAKKLCAETRLAIRERMIDGGASEKYIIF